MFMAEKPTKKSELERRRSLAEDMYIRLNMSGREIAEYFQVSEQTVSNWKKGRTGETTWDERKRDNQINPLKLKETLLEEAKNIADGNEPKIKSDALSKVMAAINMLDKTVNPRTVMAVFKLFDNFMAETNPEKAVEFTTYHKLFLQHLIALES